MNQSEPTYFFFLLFLVFNAYSAAHAQENKYKDIIKIKVRPNACKDDRGRLRVAAAVGVTADTMERVDALVNAGVDAIIIDTAHGHSKFVIEKLKEVKKK